MARRRPRWRTRKTRHAPDGSVVESAEEGLTVHRVLTRELKGSAQEEAAAWREEQTLDSALERTERWAQKILCEAGYPETVGPHADPPDPRHPGGRRIARLVQDAEGVETPAWFAAKALETIERIRSSRQTLRRRLSSARALEPESADGLVKVVEAQANAVALAAYRLRGLADLAGFKADFEPDALLGVKQRARSRKGGRGKRDQENYERTRAGAAELWKSDPTLTATGIAERLRRERVTSAALSTVRGWIRDLNPACQIAGI